MRFELYEDNAGSLYLHDVAQGWVYHDLEQTDSTFAQDAVVLAFEPERVDNWNTGVMEEQELQPILDHPETRHIATIEFHSENHGHHARRYVGL